MFGMVRSDRFEMPSGPFLSTLAAPALASSSSGKVPIWGNGVEYGWVGTRRDFFGTQSAIISSRAFLSTVGMDCRWRT